jgi:HlyD family secretion protein
MNIKKIIILGITLALAGTISFFIVKAIKNKQNKQALYKTENPQRRTIKHAISVSGLLEIKEIMKVGSIQSGFVKEIYVKENQTVKKGQLLAFIDTGKDDADVQAAQHRLEQAQKDLTYQKAYFPRQEALYKSGQLSRDNYQKAQRDFEKAQEDVLTNQALLLRATLEYDSTKVKAPDNGTVIAVYATKGMVANDVSNTILFEIAQDVTKMKATFDIDESEVGHIKPQQKVILTPNSFPDMRIKSFISEVSFTPKSGTSSAADSASASYKAQANIDNSLKLLRPGMIVNAHIDIHKVKNVISVSGPTFYINPELVQKVAKKLNYQYVPISEHEQKRLIKTQPEKIIKFVWILDNKQFIQKPITVGLSDNMFWEVTEGLAETDNIITDVEEPDEMEDLYKRWFRGSL